MFQTPHFQISKLLRWFTLMGIVVCCACSNSDLNIDTYSAPKDKLAPHGASMGMMSGEPPMDSEMPAPTAQQHSPIQWRLPKGWSNVQNSSSMRLASFKVSQSGDASIVELSGQAGGLLPNVNRWREQISLPPLTATQLQAMAHQGRAAIGAFQWFKLENEKSNQIIFAAIFSQESSTIFVKLTGQLNDLKNEDKNFLKLCESLK